jgi:hypothetical protein
MPEFAIRLPADIIGEAGAQSSPPAQVALSTIWMENSLRSRIARQPTSASAGA